MTNEQFFKENALSPTAFSIGRGGHVRFSVASEIYRRDEVELKKLASQYGLKMSKTSGHVTFYK